MLLFVSSERRLTPKKKKKEEEEWKTEQVKQWSARVLSDTALLIHVL
jgi:hypothetical protein